MASAAVWRTDPPVLCLTVEGPATTLRVASRRVSVTDERGRVLQYAGGLEEPELVTPLELGGASGGPRSVTLRCLPPYNVAERVAIAGGWGEVRGELALWCPSEPWGARVVVLRGRVQPTTWGPRGAVLELELAEPPWDDPAVWPPADAVVTREAWPDAPDSSLGARYPFVFGTPGTMRDDGGTAVSYPATPAIWIDDVNDKALICGEPVLASQVIVYNATAAASYTATVSTERDGFGRACAIVDLAGAAWTVGDELSVRDWTAGATDGGIQALDSAAALRGLGDLLLYLWLRSGLDVDLSAWRALRDEFNRIEIGGYFDEPTAVASLVRDVLLPLAPDLALAPGPRGVRPVWWRPWSYATGQQLTLAQTYARAQAQPTRADQEPITEAEVAFGYDLSAGEYRGALGVCSARWAGGELWPTAHARAGYARVRRAQGERLETAWVWRREAAADVARTLVRLYWTSPEQDEISAPLWTWPLWREGEVVFVSDAETAQIERPWWVAGVGLRDGRCVLSLLRVEDPISAPRRA